MNQNEAIAQALEQLLAEVHRLQMVEQVQKGMWALLVRHLVVKGQLDISVLMADIETLADTQESEDWQSAHEGYLTMLDVLKGRASTPC